VTLSFPINFIQFLSACSGPEEKTPAPFNFLGFALLVCADDIRIPL
jgi:hypothetical protein